METRASIELRVRGEPSATRALRGVVEQVAADHGLSDEECFRLKLAATEALTNALRDTPDEGAVDVAIVPREDAIEVEIKNSGSMAVWSPERALNPDGGRGIPLMLALVDEVQFASTEAGTLVRIRKRI
jgi:anti-sigma regulatory factor (Ser/Thr protein kinase)